LSPPPAEGGDGAVSLIDGCRRVQRAGKLWYKWPYPTGPSQLSAFPSASRLPSETLAGC